MKGKIVTYDFARTDSYRDPRVKNHCRQIADRFSELSYSHCNFERYSIYNRFSKTTIGMHFNPSKWLRSVLRSRVKNKDIGTVSITIELDKDSCKLTISAIAYSGDDYPYYYIWAKTKLTKQELLSCNPKLFILSLLRNDGKNVKDPRTIKKRVFF